MSFKPGMHQITESVVPADQPAIMVGEKPLDFKVIVEKMAQMEPAYSMPHKGVGKKAFIKANASRGGQKVAVEFFAELVFSQAPSDPLMGFREEDTVQRRGVIVYNMDPEADEATGLHKSCGEVLSYEEFVETYITDAPARIQLERLMEGMEANVTVNDKMLEQVNMMYGNLQPGDKTLYDVSYH